MGCTEFQAMTIIDELYGGDTVKAVLLKHEVPFQAFYKLVANSPTLNQEYSRVRSVRADVFADLVVHESRSDGDAQQIRNKMQALMWAAAKMKPEVYGDSVNLNVTQTVDIRAALDSAILRTRDVLDITPQLVIPAPALEPAASNEPAFNSLSELLD